METDFKLNTFDMMMIRIWEATRSVGLTDFELKTNNTNTHTEN